LGLSLGICSSGYVAQMIEAVINSIPASQWEATFLLGYSKAQSLRYIILPQMSQNVLPSLSNELDSLLKSTAVVSSIGLLELSRLGMNLVSREMEPVPIYLTWSFFYLFLSIIINLGTKKTRKKDFLC
jgi:ABC-type amino acid transport system permease subunit